MKKNTDANLVAAALNGDAVSFSRLCEQYYPALVAIAYAQLADRGLAEDAAQEALLAAYRGMARLKTPERFAGWLMATCRNIAIDINKEQGFVEHVFDDSGTMLAQVYFLKGIQQFIMVGPTIKTHGKLSLSGDWLNRIAGVLAPRGMVAYFTAGHV